MFKLTFDKLLATTIRNFPFEISEIGMHQGRFYRAQFTRESLNFSRIHKSEFLKSLTCEVYCDMTWKKKSHA